MRNEQDPKEKLNAKAVLLIAAPPSRLGGCSVFKSRGMTLDEFARGTQRAAG